MVPFNPDKLFVGRADILNEVSLMLANKHRRVVLAGIGGVG
jgi:hypothetical protein